MFASGTGTFRSVSAEPPIFSSASVRAIRRRPFDYTVIVGDVHKRTVFTDACAVAIIEKKKCNVVILSGDSGGNAAVQPTTEQDNGELFHAPLTVATVRFM